MSSVPEAVSACGKMHSNINLESIVNHLWFGWTDWTVFVLFSKARVHGTELVYSNFSLSNNWSKILRHASGVILQKLHQRKKNPPQQTFHLCHCCKDKDWKQQALKKITVLGRWAGGGGVSLCKRRHTLLTKY